MSDSKACLNARALLAEIEPLKQRFDLAYERCRATNTTIDKEEARKALALLNEKIELFKRSLLLETLEKIHLDEQYASQVTLLKQSKFAYDSLRPDESGSVVDCIYSTGVDARAHLLPTLPEIIKRMGERSGFIRSKIDQGFTRLLLVPFVRNVENMIDELRGYLQRRQNQGSPALPKRMDVNLVASTPLYKEAGMQEKLMYNLGLLGEGYKGKSKREMVSRMHYEKSWGDGWQILLVRPDAKDEKKTTILSAKELTAPARSDWDFDYAEPDKLSANEFLKQLRLAQEIGEDSSRYGEEAMTLEAWMVDLCAHIEQADQQLMETEAVLAGSCSLAGGAVPYVYIDSSSFIKVVLDQVAPELESDVANFRSVVPI